MRTPSLRLSARSGRGGNTKTGRYRGAECLHPRRSAAPPSFRYAGPDCALSASCPITVAVLALSSSPSLCSMPPSFRRPPSHQRADSSPVSRRRTAPLPRADPYHVLLFVLDSTSRLCRRGLQHGLPGQFSKHRAQVAREARTGGNLTPGTTCHPEPASPDRREGRPPRGRVITGCSKSIHRYIIHPHRCPLIPIVYHSALLVVSPYDIPFQRFHICITFMGFQRTTDPVIKCMLVGDSDVGKTCLLTAYAENRFPTSYIPRKYDNNNAIPVMAGDVPCTLQVFDTPGGPEYEHQRPLGYPCSDVFLICFSIGLPASLESVKTKWFSEAQHHHHQKRDVLIRRCKAI
ncbi:P-loop containing nucleoside triphosphate hydrolase protein [Mycena sanguinolenta]|nr:P-loop containing nucleoside triphosphate hydrolase protein [Mycena sanguinolenta]